MGVLCRKWHKTLQEDKGLLGREENWQFVFRKNMEDGGHLLLCTLLFPACLTKKLIQISAVLDFWEYKGCEDADELPCLCTINSSLTCWT